MSRCGHPREPRPKDPLNPYIRVGDVGSVFNGRFLRGFNVFCNEDDPLNRFGVPENFTPVNLLLQETVEGYPIPAGALCSKDIVQDGEVMDFNG